MQNWFCKQACVHGTAFDSVMSHEPQGKLQDIGFDLQHIKQVKLAGSAAGHSAAADLQFNPLMKHCFRILAAVNLIHC